jgi:hypothetical protein
LFVTYPKTDLLKPSNALHAYWLDDDEKPAPLELAQLEFDDTPRRVVILPVRCSICLLCARLPLLTCAGIYMQRAVDEAILAEATVSVEFKEWFLVTDVDGRLSSLPSNQCRIIGDQVLVRKELCRALPQSEPAVARSRFVRHAGSLWYRVAQDHNAQVELLHPIGHDAHLVLAPMGPQSVRRVAIMLCGSRETPVSPAYPGVVEAPDVGPVAPAASAVPVRVAVNEFVRLRFIPGARVRVLVDARYNFICFLFVSHCFFRAGRARRHPT